MQDWQIAVLNSENIGVDQDQSTGYRLVIRKTDAESRMSIPTIVAVIRKSNRKPVIMCPDGTGRGMFADRREVLDILMSTEEYEEFAIWMAEAKLNGVIRWETAQSSPLKRTLPKGQDWASIHIGMGVATVSRDSWSIAD